MRRLLETAALAAAFACAPAARAEWELRADLIYPGASVHDLIESTLPKVERTLRVIPGVTAVRSTLRPGRVFTTMTVSDAVTDRRAMRCEARQLLSAQFGELPSPVFGIEVLDLYERTYPLVLAVSGRGTDMRELKFRAHALADELLAVPEVADARLVGEEQEVVSVEVPSGPFLRNCGLPGLKEMIATSLDVEQAGWINVGTRKLRIVPADAGCRPDDLLNKAFTVFCKNGKTETVMLRDNVKVTISRRARAPDVMAGVDGERAVLVAVSFQPKADAFCVDGLVKRLREASPLGVEIGVAHDVRRRFAASPCVFDLRVREGSSIESTDAEARLVAKAIRGVPGVVRVMTVTGESDLPFVPGQEILPPADNHTLIFASVDDGADRTQVLRTIAARVADRSARALIMPRASAAQDGFGTPVRHCVTGGDPARVRAEADRLVDAARAVVGVRTAVSDWGEPVESLRYSLYGSRARQLCLTHKNISQACCFALEGVEITSVWDRGERLPVMLRLDRGAVKGPQDLSTLWAYSNALDRFVPFSQVVSGFESVSEPGCAVRENGRYVATVTAFADGDAAAAAVRRAWGLK